MAKKIVVFGPHPDDAEFGCGGILIKEVMQGNQVTIVVMSKGEAGSAGTPEEREQEARAVAKVIGAEIEFMDFGGDCQIEYTIENRLRIAEKIRQLQPDILLAPAWFENQHPDHRIVSELVRDASRLARYGGLVELEHFAPHKITSLYYYAVTRFPLATPDIVVDISDVIDKWEQVMGCHQSQLSNMKYNLLQHSKARLLGLNSGVEFAMGLWTNDPVMVDRVSDIGKSARNF